MGRGFGGPRRAEKCWSYSPQRGPTIPVIKAVLRTLDGRLNYPVDASEAEMEVDSGYDGFILIPDWCYYRVLQLERFELPEVGEIVTPIGASQGLYSARALVELPLLKVREMSIVETFYGCNELLVGRGFLNNYRLLHDGPEGQLCFYPHTSGQMGKVASYGCVSS